LTKVTSQNTKRRCYQDWNYIL